MSNPANTGRKFRQTTYIDTEHLVPHNAFLTNGKSCHNGQVIVFDMMYDYGTVRAPLVLEAQVSEGEFADAFRIRSETLNNALERVGKTNLGVMNRIHQLSPLAPGKTVSDPQINKYINLVRNGQDQEYACEVRIMGTRKTGYKSTVRKTVDELKEWLGNEKWKLGDMVGKILVKVRVSAIKVTTGWIVHIKCVPIRVELKHRMSNARSLIDRYSTLMFPDQDITKPEVQKAVPEKITV